MSLDGNQMHHSTAWQRIGKRRLFIIVPIVLVILVLAAGGTAYALLGRDTTTVTITPASSIVSNTYTLSGVPGVPDASQNQVSARQISVNTPAQTKTVKASGHLSAPATAAKGTLILRNWDTKAPKTFEAGRIYPDINGDRVLLCGSTAGIELVLDTTVTVPAEIPGAGPSIAYVSGHFLEAGAVGNIPLNGTGTDGCYYYLWVDGHCPGGWLAYCWTIEPAKPFTGGQDAYDGPVVQQSDIDTATHDLLSANQPNPQEVLQPQMQSNEQLIDAPQCTANISPYQQAGDHAAQATVSLYYTCTAEVYDQKAAFALATRMLTAQATADPGTGYALVGHVKTDLISVVFGDHGTMTLTIAARGVWAYPFTDAQKQQLAKALAGRSKPEAIQIAGNQPGVAYVTIHLIDNQQSLPTDPQQITVLVQTVPEA